MSWSQNWRREGRIPFDVLQTELKRFVEGCLQPASNPDPGPRSDFGVDRPWIPPVDVYETPEEIVVVVELPGIDAGQVDLSIADNLLVVRGARPPDDRPEEQVRVQERRFGPFLREIPIPGVVDFEAARAETVHGVLTIRLPRRRAGAPRTIPVRTG